MLSEQETNVCRRNKSFSFISAMFSFLDPGHESWVTIAKLYIFQVHPTESEYSLKVFLKQWVYSIVAEFDIP